MFDLILDPFSEEEKAKIREHALQKENYEEEHAELSRKAREVSVKIIEAQAALGAIYNKRSPFFALPIEVTCLIFHIARVEGGIDDDSDEEEEQEGKCLSEVTISHVCRRWRQIALGYPSLWASFCYEGPEATRIPLDRLDAYLQRSGSQPLELWLEFRGAGEDADHLLLFKKAIEHVHRWKRVTVLSDAENPIRRLLLQLQYASAPLLEHLALSPDTSCECDARPAAQIMSLQPVIFQGGAPRLTSALLDSASMATCIMPFANIITLRIEENEQTSHNFSIFTFLEILSLPFLKDLSILGELFSNDSDNSYVGFISMPALKHLRFGDTENFCELLPNIRAPLLETLVVQGCSFLEGFGPAATLTAKTYSFPSLREFWMIETTAEATAAQELVKMTSEVTKVMISHESLVDSFLSTINNHLTAQITWPRLKNLTCNIEGITTAAPYLAFARTRSKDSLTLYLFGSLIKHWAAEEEVNLEAMKNICTIKEMEPDSVSISEHWPPDFDFSPKYYVDDKDPFNIDSYYDC